MKVIDATDLGLGRMSTQIAKLSLAGEQISIINSEKALITGRPVDVIKTYSKKRDIGSRYQGPFFPKRPDRIVKRTIRGMLPYKKLNGKKALDRVKAYIAVPEEFKGKKFETIEAAKIDKIRIRNYIILGELSKHIGAFWYEPGKEKEEVPPPTPQLPAPEDKPPEKPIEAVEKPKEVKDEGKGAETAEAEQAE